MNLQKKLEKLRLNRKPVEINQLLDALRNGTIFLGTSSSQWLQLAIDASGTVITSVMMEPRHLRESWNESLTIDQSWELTNPSTGGVLIVHADGISIYTA